VIIGEQGSEGSERTRRRSVTYVVNGSDEEKHLGPAEGGDNRKGSNTVRDIGTWDARGNVEWEAEDLGDDVSEHTELGNTSVLQLRDTVLVEGVLVDVGGKSERIEEASWGDNSELVLVRHGESRGGGGHTSRGGEGSGRADEEGSSDSGLHFVNSAFCAIEIL